MSETNPHKSDLVLGGQNPPPTNAAILGGLAGVKQRLESESIEQRIQTLNDTVQYGKDSIDLLMQSLSDSADEVSKLAYELLCDRLDKIEQNKLFRVLSSDPKSKPHLLAKISLSNDLATIKNLANNPNTSPDILSKLGNTGNMSKMLAENIQGWSKFKYKVKSNPFGYGYGAVINLKVHYQKLADTGISTDIIETIKSACEIYRDIARNPNSPIPVLLILGGLFPKDFLDNPVLPQLILESPNFIYSSFHTQRAIAEHPDTPIDILKYLLEFGGISLRKEIAANPNTTLDILEQLTKYVLNSKTEVNPVSVGIAENYKAPACILEKLAEYREQIIIRHSDFVKEEEEIKYKLGQAIAEHPNTPKDLRIKMSSVSQNMF
jgi:hypothetical protein